MEILRCAYCNKPFTDDDMKGKLGCPECGSRRFRGTGSILTDAEMDGLIARGFKPEEHGWEQNA